MIKTGSHRALAAIAIQNSSEAELRRLHEMISGISPSAFVELIRDIEDEIGNSLRVALEGRNEKSAQSDIGQDVFREIEKIRKNQLRMPVARFAEAFAVVLVDLTNNTKDVPKFDSRRGLQSWIERLVQRFGEKFVLHAAIRASGESETYRSSDWKLR